MKVRNYIFHIREWLLDIKGKYMVATIIYTIACMDFRQKFMQDG